MPQGPVRSLIRLGDVPHAYQLQASEGIVLVTRLDRRPIPDNNEDVFQINGIDWVAARSGGISTFSMQWPGANWWLLPSGYDYPDELTVVNDHGNHYNWEPSVDMPLTDYIVLLTSVESAFRKVS